MGKLAPRENDYLDAPGRLEALYRLNILDTESEEAFDAITRPASTLSDVPIATIHLLDDDMHLQRLLGSETETPPEIAMIQARLGRLERVKRGYGSAVSNQILQDIAERIQASSGSEELGLIHPIGLWVFETSLEITESALIERFDEVSGLLDALTEAGFPLALDDFGTGHSSLSRLINLPFSVLKVDRAFVSDSPDGPGAAVVASLVELAKSLRLDALGEGIETEAHEAFLRGHGYGLGQGFRYAGPLSGDAFLARIHGE